MTVKVLGIAASPRINGNSDILLQKALEGAESAGARTEYIRLAELNIAPCIECNRCYKTGSCQTRDDFQVVISKILDAERLIFATPVFFMTVCAQAKLLIDRCQCLWARKVVLKKPLETTGTQPRCAMVIAVGGSGSKKMFESVRLTMKSWFDVLDLHYSRGLFVNRVDKPGDVERHPAAMSRAFRLGQELAHPDIAPAEKPLNIELT